LCRDAPDIVFAGYPANPKAGYPANPKAGYRISGKGRISGRLDNYIFGQISNKFIKTTLAIIGFCKHSTTHDLLTYS
jgi:hypothetical protein